MPDVNLQDLTGPDRIVDVDADENIVGREKLPIAPATVYDVLSGQAGNAPNADLALHRWNTFRRTGAIVAGVALFDWPGPGAGETERSSNVSYDVTADVAMAVASITDANLLSQNPRRYTLEMTFNNVSAVSLVVSLAAAAAGRMPIRYAPGVTNATLRFGQSAVAIIEIFPSFALVRSFVLAGKPVPGRIIQLLANAAAGVNLNQIGSFSPDLVDDADIADRVFVFPMRVDGTNMVVPSDKGYSTKLNRGYDATTGLLMADASHAGKLIVSDARTGDGPFGGTGSFSGWDIFAAIATRGGVLFDYGGLAGSGASFQFPPLTGLPDGTIIFGVSARALNSQVKPPAAVTLTKADNSPAEAYSPALGWSVCAWRDTPVAGAWAPPAIAQTSCLWFSHIIAVAPVS